MPDELPGGGETGALIRSLDWSKTPLGPIASWPMSLKSLVRAMMYARQPMILWWGPELTQLYNDAMVPSLGLKHPSGMGQSARISFGEVWETVGHQLEAVMNEGVSIWQEDVLVPLDRNGRLEDAWWTYNYSPIFDDDGVRSGILISTTETTAGVVARAALTRAQVAAERARAELYEAFMQSPTAIAILVGPDYKFVFANAPYEQLVGRKVVGFPLLDVFTEAEVGHFRPLLDRAFKEGEPHTVEATPLSLVSRDGIVEKRIIDVTYQPYRDADGVIVGAIAQVTDVTTAVLSREAAQKQAEERALSLAREQELRRNAEAYARSRDNFLAMLSHELRNPLASIGGAIELMDARHDTQGVREREIIARQLRHLTQLVDDLLDSARITRGKLELRREHVDLDTVIRSAIEQVATVVEERRHQLNYVAPVKEVVVDGDVVRLAQVIANLLTNAARYTPPGGVIEIGAVRDGPLAVITVTDTGPGFAPDLLVNAFDLFIQGERRAGREEGGLGLGLALVKQLVVMHGGTVGVRNRDQGGSELTIRLPALDVSSRPQSPKREQPVGVSRRILIVDDNADAGLLLGEILQMRGHEVATACDATEALSLLSRFHPDVGIFDIGLPGIDGYELARRVRALPGGREMRLAAVTGYGAPSDRQDAIAAGFDIHLTKPITLATLLAFAGEP